MITQETVKTFLWVIIPISMILLLIAVLFIFGAKNLNVLVG